MDGQYWRPNHVNKRVVADIWLLTVSWTLTWEMMRIRNFYCFVYRQHIWLRKWEVIVGDMIDHVGIYGSRVAEGLSALNVGLVLFIKNYWKPASQNAIIGRCWSIYAEINAMGPNDDKSALAQVMAQCTRKTFMIHQTFVRWAVYVLFKFVKSLITHLGLAIGYVRCVWWFSWTLMACSHQATSHYMSQCWLCSMSSYGITRPKWGQGCGLSEGHIASYTNVEFHLTKFQTYAMVAVL